ncbi:uncharacterized protein [Gossypium hirsutum]|uniref:RVP_2 domain-containing protein n=1 Tax=Gossypium hirsutum TaxID=3635 RepID=A0A1U8I1E1_GOSHI|nr:uncharacterized protein LOC107890008 [Gossypium hirsutum]
MGRLELGPLVTVTRLQLCTDCGRRYQGECWRMTEACLRFGSLEHHIRECPLRADQMQTPDTDIRSTHLYIANNISGNLGISVKSTTSKVMVLSLLGQFVRVSKLYKDVLLEVQGVIFLADLMELSFGEFDLTLGMNWLVKHCLSLDYATKRVVLRTEENKEMVRKGCEAFLAYVNVSDSGNSTVKDIKIVKDFSNVFPEKLPGLPPNYKLEFRIELLLGTAPVSIAPYRIALKKLVELKAQIQKLCY